MDKNQETGLSNILSRAQLDKKGNYHIYNSYKRMIEGLMLTSTEYEQAIRKLASILKV